VPIGSCLSSGLSIQAFPPRHPGQDFALLRWLRLGAEVNSDFGFRLKALSRC
jgi:hypothetical protein